MSIEKASSMESESSFRSDMSLNCETFVQSLETRTTINHHTHNRKGRPMYNSRKTIRMGVLPALILTLCVSLAVDTTHAQFSVSNSSSDTVLIVKDDGNVGIGTTSPTASLDVVDYIKVSNSFGNRLFEAREESANLGIMQVSFGNVVKAKVASNGDSFFNGGDVGIGTTNPLNKLHIHENSSGFADLQITNNTTGSASSTDGFRVALDGSENGSIGIEGDKSLRFITNNLERMTVQGDGNVGIGTTSAGNILTIQQTSATDPIADAWTTYSSRRWKANIKRIDGALDKVQRMRGVSYDWKADGKHDIGLIAEEVGEVIPEVVAYEHNGKDAKSVDYARLVAVLIEAVKEQQKIIDEQNSKIAAIEARIGNDEYTLNNSNQ